MDLVSIVRGISHGYTTYHTKNSESIKIKRISFYNFSWCESNIFIEFWKHEMNYTILLLYMIIKPTYFDMLH